MRKKINILLGIIGVIVILSLLFVVNYKHKHNVCKKIDITINYHNTEAFITINEIENFTKKNGKSFVIGKKVSELKLKSIEDTLEKVPYIKEVDVYTTLDGVLHIKVIQRHPILRIINKKGVHFYIDQESVLMPANKAVRVLVANGEIYDNYKEGRKLFVKFAEIADTTLMSKSILHQLFILSLYINSNDFLRSLTTQLYYNDKKEIEPIPLLGNQVILLGKIENYKEKLKNLELFYKYGMSAKGWSDYSLINIKYNNRIICTKK